MIQLPTISLTNQMLLRNLRLSHWYMMLVTINSRLCSFELPLHFLCQPMGTHSPTADQSFFIRASVACYLYRSLRCNPLMHLSSLAMAIVVLGREPVEE